MRTIERSSAFKRDYKRAKATPRHGYDLDRLVLTERDQNRRLDHQAGAGRRRREGGGGGHAGTDRGASGQPYRAVSGTGAGAGAAVSH